MDELQWLRWQLEMEKARRQLAEQQLAELRISLESAYQHQHSEKHSGEAKEQQKVENIIEERSCVIVSEKKTIEIAAVNEVASVKSEVSTSSPRSPGTTTVYLWNGVFFHVRHFQKQIDEGIRLILDKLLVYCTLDNDIVFEKEAEDFIDGIASGDEDFNCQGRNNEFHSSIFDKVKLSGVKVEAAKFIIRNVS